MEDLKILNKNIEIDEETEETDQDNITVWTVTGMLIIWLYIIIMSLF